MPEIPLNLVLKINFLNIIKGAGPLHANFDVGVSCSSIFVFKGIVYDVVHTRLE